MGGGVSGYWGWRTFVRDFRGRGVVFGEVFETRVGVEGEANLCANSRMAIMLLDGEPLRLGLEVLGVSCV